MVTKKDLIDSMDDYLLPEISPEDKLKNFVMGLEFVALRFENSVGDSSEDSDKKEGLCNLFKSLKNSVIKICDMDQTLIDLEFEKANRDYSIKEATAYEGTDEHGRVVIKTGSTELYGESTLLASKISKNIVEHTTTSGNLLTKMTKSVRNILNKGDEEDRSLASFMATILGESACPAYGDVNPVMISLVDDCLSQAEAADVSAAASFRGSSPAASSAAVPKKTMSSPPPTSFTVRSPEAAGKPFEDLGLGGRK
jgi:hypothetical protein